MPVPCSVQVGVAEAIVDSINIAESGTFVTDEFQATRSWADWQLEIEEEAGLLVDVVPAGFRDTQPETRDDVSYSVETDIVIRRRVPAAARLGTNGRIANGELDFLSLLTEQIYEHFLNTRSADFDEAACIGATIRLPYSRKHLQELSQWVSIVRIAHDATKQLGVDLTCSE